MENARRRIRDMVRAALTGEPGVTNKVLLARAREIAPEAVEGMTLQQFHGSFRLPVSRELSSGKRRAQKRTRATSASADKPRGDTKSTRRDAVRDVLRRFAVELSRAERRGEIVRAVARTDEFVDELMRILDASAEPVEPAPRRRARRSTATRARDEAPARRFAAAEPPAAEAPDRPPRDMRPRRRPKAVLAARAAEPAPSSPAEDQAEDASPQEATSETTEPKRPEIFTLTHDLEEFRRRRSTEPRIRRPGT